MSASHKNGWPLQRRHEAHGERGKPDPSEERLIEEGLVEYYKLDWPRRQQLMYEALDNIDIEASGERIDAIDDYENTSPTYALKEKLDS